MPAIELIGSRSAGDAVLHAPLGACGSADPRRLIRRVERVLGVRFAVFNRFEGAVAVCYDSRRVSEARLWRVLRAPERDAREGWMQAVLRFDERYGVFFRLTAAAVFVALSYTLKTVMGSAYTSDDLSYRAVNGAVVLLGYAAYIRALSTLFWRAQMTVDLLVVVIVFCALAVGQWTVAATLVLISIASETVRQVVGVRADRSLIRLAVAVPNEARVLRGGERRTVALHEIREDDTVLLEDEDGVPVDGLVTAGQAWVREPALLSGEEKTREVIVGDRVTSGSRILAGAIDVLAERAGRGTFVGRLDRLIFNARRLGSQTDDVVRRLSNVFVSSVLFLGILGFMVYGQFAFAEHKVLPLDILARELPLMIAICPFALLLAAPVGVYIAIVSAAGKGILFKGGHMARMLARVRCMIFDKTGTLTRARPTLVDIKGFDGVSADDVLRAALFVERLSGHPVARAICDYARRQRLIVELPDEHREVDGIGMEARKGENVYAVGTRRMMEGKREIPISAYEWLADYEDKGFNTVFVADGRRVIGGMALQDEAREDAAAVLSGLRARGLQRAVLVSGDDEYVLARLTRDLPLDDSTPNCRAETKRHLIRDLRRRGQRVAFVGDGVNDDEELKAADVGIVVGGAGSDESIDEAGVVLLRNRLSTLVDAVDISRSMVRAIRINHVLAIAGSLTMVLPALAGWIGLQTVALGQLGLVVAVSALSAMLVYRR